MGHINNYCGNKEEAKKNWYQALKMMEEEGYYASMPPICLNIVNVAFDDSFEEADSLLTLAKEISQKYSPERVFDIEARQTLSYFIRGDMEKFLEGYNAFKEGEQAGRSSVHAKNLEIYHEIYLGHIDEAISIATEEYSDDGVRMLPMIYEKAGRWEEAYYALKKETAANDSIDNVVLTNSMRGIQDEILLYEAYRKNSQQRIIALGVGFGLAILLIIAMFYIMQSRRKYIKRLKVAYRRAMESDKMKSAFISNISHEIRTPLNIISGFSQVIADPDLTESVEERQHMSKMMQDSSQQVTKLIDEIIGLSLIESTEKLSRKDKLQINPLLRQIQEEYQKIVKRDVEIKTESTLDEDFKITTNENMLKRILISLMDNAAKNTTEGSIMINVSQDNGKLTFIIEDTGCGVPANEADRIFERFVKLDSFKEGIGLGLPLSRKLAEQLDGSLTLDTSYTNGARFVLTLPIL